MEINKILWYSKNIRSNCVAKMYSWFLLCCISTPTLDLLHVFFFFGISLAAKAEKSLWIRIRNENDCFHPFECVVFGTETYPIWTTTRRTEMMQKEERKKEGNDMIFNGFCRKTARNLEYCKKPNTIKIWISLVESFLVRNSSFFYPTCFGR